MSDDQIVALPRADYEALKAELDRLLSAEAERQVLRGTVAAVRALCDEAELAGPSVVFSQGGPQWAVWTSEVRAALDSGEAS